MCGTLIYVWEGKCMLLWTRVKAQLYAKVCNYLAVIDPFQIIVCFIFFSLILKWCFNKKKKTIAWHILCSMWLTIIFEITLLGRKNDVINTWNSVFSSFSELASSNYTIIYDMVFNVVLFIPLGFLMRMKCSVKYSVVISGGVSLFIEVMQLITHRGLFEISDLIFNTIGGMIGIVCMIFTQKFVKICSLKL